MTETTQDADRKIQGKLTPPKDDYFMGKLLMDAAICRDPNIQQAALIIDSKERFVTFGVNHYPSMDYNLDKFTWSLSHRELAMVTAEEAAIYSALKRYSTPGSAHVEPFTSHDMYTTGPPTLRAIRCCAANALKTIIYGPMVPEYFDEKDWVDAQVVAKAYQISIKRFTGNLGWIRDRINTFSHLFEF